MLNIMTIDSIIQLAAKCLGTFVVGLIFLFCVALLYFGIIMAFACAAELYTYEKDRIRQIRKPKESCIELELDGSGGTVVINTSSIKLLHISGRVIEIQFKDGSKNKYMLKDAPDPSRMTGRSKNG